MPMLADYIAKWTTKSTDSRLGCLLRNLQLRREERRLGREAHTDPERRRRAWGPPIGSRTTERARHSSARRA